MPAAEIRVLLALEYALPDDWVILRGVRVPHGDSQEADLLLVKPLLPGIDPARAAEAAQLVTGLVFVEVKGGGVFYENGALYQRKPRGGIKGPIVPAQQAARAAREVRQWFDRTLVDQGVRRPFLTVMTVTAFPDVDGPSLGLAADSVRGACLQYRDRALVLTREAFAVEAADGLKETMAAALTEASGLARRSPATRGRWGPLDADIATRLVRMIHSASPPEPPCSGEIGLRQQAWRAHEAEQLAHRLDGVGGMIDVAADGGDFRARFFDKAAASWMLPARTRPPLSASEAGDPELAALERLAEGLEQGIDWTEALPLPEVDAAVPQGVWPQDVLQGCGSRGRAPQALSVGEILAGVPGERVGEDLEATVGNGGPDWLDESCILQPVAVEPGCRDAAIAGLASVNTALFQNIDMATRQWAALCGDPGLQAALYRLLALAFRARCGDAIAGLVEPAACRQRARRGVAERGDDPAALPGPPPEHSSWRIRTAVVEAMEWCQDTDRALADGINWPMPPAFGPGLTGVAIALDGEALTEGVEGDGAGRVGAVLRRAVAALAAAGDVAAEGIPPVDIPVLPMVEVSAGAPAAVRNALSTLDDLDLHRAGLGTRLALAGLRDVARHRLLDRPPAPGGSRWRCPPAGQLLAAMRPCGAVTVAGAAVLDFTTGAAVADPAVQAALKTGLGLLAEAWAGRGHPDFRRANGPKKVTGAGNTHAAIWHDALWTACVAGFEAPKAVQERLRRAVRAKGLVPTCATVLTRPDRFGTPRPVRWLRVGPQIVEALADLDAALTAGGGAWWEQFVSSASEFSTIG